MYTFTVFLSLWTRILLPLLFPGAAATKEKPLIAPVEKVYVQQVLWSPDRHLSWKDFKANPDEDNPHHALTAANLAVNAQCQQNGFSYQVSCVFLPTQSWTKNTESDKLLKHEQLHFDLTEVHARLLRRKLEALDCADLKDRLSVTVASAFAQWKAEQNAFDADCKHGLNTAREHVWATNIAQRLKKLEAYQ